MHFNHKDGILGAFHKLRKATISFVMSVRPSVRPPARPHGTIRLALDGFSSNLVLDDFLKLSRIFKSD
jgi:hypothetical protein